MVGLDIHVIKKLAEATFLIYALYVDHCHCSVLQRLGESDDIKIHYLKKTTHIHFIN